MVPLTYSKSSLFQKDRKLFCTLLQVREAAAFPGFIVLSILITEIAFEISFRIKG